jgi:hypothetical protein
MAQTFIENLASALLTREGSAAIPQLRNAAVSARRCDRLDTAATLRCTAEAAEREHLGRFCTPYIETGF